MSPTTKDIAVGAAALAAASLGLTALTFRRGERSSWKDILTFTAPKVQVSGFVKPGYEAVKDAFRGNFEAGQGWFDSGASFRPLSQLCSNALFLPDIGASFSAYINGECVVDIYAGNADLNGTRPYTETTINPIFSSGKAVMAIVVAKLVSEGHINYEDPIAKYWPEFAQGGKEKVTVSDVLAHVGGVAWLDPDFLPTNEQVCDLDELAKKIAGQPHNFKGERRVTYHAACGGFFLNEVVRRVDPKKRSCGTILREDIMPLLDLEYGTQGNKTKAEIYCGLPESLESRVAIMKPYPQRRLIARALLPGFITGSPLPAELLEMRNDAGLIKALSSIPKTTGPNIFQGGMEAFRGEGSSYNMVSNASSLAKLLSIMSLGGSPIVSPEVFKKALTDLEPAPTVCLGRVMTVGGFGRINKKSPVVFDGFENPVTDEYKWYGWHGAGGSVFQFCPEKKIAVAYTMNAMNPYFGGDFRGGKCAKAVVDCFEKLGK